METQEVSHSVLITGGSSGIGLGLATRYLTAGHRVMITGRNPHKLAAISEGLPGLETFASDMACPRKREDLAAHVRQTMPDLDIVISNAGIQRRVGIAADDAPWAEAQNEIDILLAGPIHLARLLVPQLLGHGRRSVYVNVTSGGAFLPQPFAPLYSAAKAALHSYTVNLRHALRATPCRVVELIPPAVATQLAGPGHNHGADPEEFCDTVFPLLDGSHTTVGFGRTAQPDFTERLDAEQRAFESASMRFHVPLYQPDGTVEPAH
ncbi:SDR family NAD(P)-dependent oxidoreductase [Streptomyces sp. SID14478]|uniref:SDR family NAD(P)-dependent oxidoreductase n=1 Tax=Streptomyces sp. SID14478 TaxID=2706073 RepID=UPI0013DA8B4E|nr:SDR family NAD(P)-dependent oxidoreductase [Streptomyces sp. SID14478]NEB74691.1 SDR family NAD(P)-dependent oxidoreductase [Streptomyces sp. SID14478]